MTRPPTGSGRGRKSGAGGGAERISPATASRRREQARRTAALENENRPAPPFASDEEVAKLCALLSTPPNARVVAEIRQLAQGTLYRVPSLRPSAVVTEIKKALARARSGKPERIRLSRRAWAMI